MGNRDVVEACRGDSDSMSWGTGMSWKHVVGNRDVVEACRGEQASRGSVSWGTRDVVEVCRGQHTFCGGCRGDNASMSWGTGMS